MPTPLRESGSRLGAGQASERPERAVEPWERRGPKKKKMAAAAAAASLRGSFGRLGGSSSSSSSSSSLLLRLLPRRPPSPPLRALSQGGEGSGLEGGRGPGRGSKEAVEELVRAHPVVVFLKGSPAQPQCGFSNAVVQVLRLHGVRDYRAYDVLQDPELRQGIKNYSNWPTIPQVFLNGEFVGGCDILLQMHQSGDLVEELKKLGIRSALLDSEQDHSKK
ncbi:hypothetical protein JRQ81_019016 [Phrynocephalus forsythii]|uniref:Glutaredoxin-related protein 5, mitochondrial n=1 Tax=Phrynocephalus forsythii TaxID=171643 RepID=A0A9Q1AZZ3_9SAUR|nr:hypothetical protein JRQ81_019016 [Phrynocephalus forsythii]